MRARTRRSIAGTAAVLVALGVYNTSGSPQAAAITGTVVALAILATGLYRPTRRRATARHQRPRQRARQPRLRAHLAHRLEHSPQVLYRLFDRYGVLLYIGVCVIHAGRDIWDRIRDHEDTKTWFGEVDLNRSFIEYYPNRTAVYAAEAHAIHTEHPRENKQHNGDHPYRRCPAINRAKTRGHRIPIQPLPYVPPVAARR